MSKILGPVVFKLKREDFHLKHQAQILEFYRAACVHKSEECRLNAAFNLPCMNALYRQHLGNTPNMVLSSPQLKVLTPPSLINCSSASLAVQSEVEESKEEPPENLTFSFDNCYLMFSRDNENIRQMAAASIHEGFIAAGDKEDTTVLRSTFHEMMIDQSELVLTSLVPKLDDTLEHYANSQAIQNFNPNDQ